MPFDGVLQPLFAPAILRAGTSTSSFVSVDMETRAVRNLPRVGVFNYVECPHFAILCMGFSFGYEEEVLMWRMGQPLPPRLVRHIERGGMLHAWNAQFERKAWQKGFKDFVQPRREQWRCTMVRGFAAGLPGKLELAAIAMQTSVQKDAEGAKIMRQMTRPRAMLEGEPIWHNAPEKWRLLMRYCAQDVRAERAIGARLPYLSAAEERQYWYDQRVADRGVYIDTALCRSAISLASVRGVQLARICRKHTGVGPAQPAALRAWIEKQGVKLPNLKKETVAAAIKAKGTPEKVRAILKLRQEAAKTSTTKFKKALLLLTDDGTLKGARQFYGAHTGRWAGRGVQLDNLLRPTLGSSPGGIPAVVEAVRKSSAELLLAKYGSIMEPVANATRSMVKAAPGHELHVGDFKSIESRVLAYTSGQQEVLEAWAASDAGDKTQEVYVLLAADMFGIHPSKVTKEQRFWGKTAELSLGYQSGCAPLIRSAEKGGASFRDIYPIVYRNADEETRAKVSRLWRLVGKGDEKSWRAARFVVERWRKKNPRSVKLWYALQAASVRAVRNPGTIVPCELNAGISFRFDKASSMLFCKLLSGRELCYPSARVVTGRNARGEPELQLRAKYMSDKAHAYVEYHPYGGFLTENVVQAQARDIMASRFEELERNCFKLVHTVHDEIITQARIGLCTTEEFRRITTRVPSWAKGFPLAIDPWKGPFYMKAD